MGLLKKITAKFKAATPPAVAETKPAGPSSPPVLTPSAKPASAASPAPAQASAAPAPIPAVAKPITTPARASLVPQAPADKVKFFLTAASNDLRSGNLISAETNVKLALTFNPRSPECKALLDEIAKKKQQPKS